MLNIIYIFGNNIKDKVNLQKNSIYKKKQIKFSKKIFKKIEKTKKLKNIFRDYIKTFVETLIDRNANFDFSNCMKNIKNLNIIVLTGDKQMNCKGKFVLDENTIYINENSLSKTQDTIFHELFHMASFNHSKKIAGGFQHGFTYEGINEGYTQLLTNKYFKNSTNHFEIETEFALLLEFIIGSQLMEKLYSTANISALLNEIGKYNENNQDYASSFLKQIDDFRLICYLPANEFTSEKRDELIKILKNIMIGFIEMFVNKLKLEKIDIGIEKFFSHLIYKIKTKNEVHLILSSQEIDKYKITCYKSIEIDKQTKLYSKINKK